MNTEKNIEIEKLILLFQISQYLGIEALNSYDSIEELNSILEQVERMESNPAIVDLIKEHIQYLVSNHEPELKHNEPIEQLLIKLKDEKQRDSVIPQIMNRFYGLDYERQESVMEVFLEMPSYREWCYAELRKIRMPRFDDRIIELWNEYRDKECRRLLCEILPEDKMKAIFDNILQGIDRNDYFTIVKRFGKSDWFVLDEELLMQFDEIDLHEESKYSNYPFDVELRNYYYNLLFHSMSKKVLSSAECGEIMHKYLHSLLNEIDEVDIIDGIVASGRQINGDQKPAMICYDLLHVRLRMVPGLLDYLLCLIAMGQTDLALGIMSWMYNLNKLLPDIDETMMHDNPKLYHKERGRLYYQLARENMPVNFEDVEISLPKGGETLGYNDVLQECLYPRSYKVKTAILPF